MLSPPKNDATQRFGELRVNVFLLGEALFLGDQIEVVQLFQRERARPAQLRAAPELYDEVLLALVETGTAMEVNTSGLRQKAEETYPSPPIVARYRAMPNVSYAEPDYIVTAADTTPTDPMWASQWDMTRIAAPAAWDTTTGSESVVVAIVDTGVSFAHPDLAANIWSDPTDPTVHGYTCMNGSCVPGGADDYGHGTHVAGTIGAVADSVGMAGLNWKVRLLSIKFLGSNGSGSVSDAVLGFNLLQSMKASGVNIRVTNNSWGGGGYSSALQDAIDRGGDAGILFVAAAGNSTSNNDTTDNYPSNYQCTKGGARDYDCLIAVASLTSAGSLSSFSSFGRTTVDLAAPGSSIRSTYPTDTYEYLSGTSMATPHVTGAVAICASINPSLNAPALRSAVLNSTAPTTSMAGITVTGGRLDVGTMVNQCSPPTGPVSGAPADLTVTAPTAFSARLQWTDGTTGETFQEIQQAPAGCANPVTVATVVPSATGCPCSTAPAANESD